MTSRTVSKLLFVFRSFPRSNSLTQVIRKFAKQLDEWLKIALHDLPENLRNIKFECKYLIIYYAFNPVNILMFF